MNRDDNRIRAAGRIAAHLLKSGLAASSLRQLAAAAGVSDRMLLYYFDDKADVLSSGLQKLASDLAVILAAAMPETMKVSPAELIAETARLVSSDTVKPYMLLWIELIAAAARGEQPHVDISRQIAAGFLDWIERRLDVTPSETRTTAAMILALVDGLAVLETCSDQKLMRQAAARIGDLIGRHR
ncbi:MAG: TetR family transcriptional regulator [Bradyrhizobium icense]|nr:MAG: TetR family transcriptional regulator [Bradyrhizobium icense]